MPQERRIARANEVCDTSSLISRPSSCWLLAWAQTYAVAGEGHKWGWCTCVRVYTKMDVAVARAAWQRKREREGDERSRGSVHTHPISWRHTLADVERVGPSLRLGEIRIVGVVFQPIVPATLVLEPPRLGVPHEALEELEDGLAPPARRDARPPAPAWVRARRAETQGAASARTNARRKSAAAAPRSPSVRPLSIAAPQSTGR